jgi:predicted DNA-binding transcriptional regulator AlpA
MGHPTKSFGALPNYSEKQPEAPSRQTWLEEGLAVPEAAQFLGLAVSTLAKLRMSGDGPQYFLLGRKVVYTRRHLLEWREKSLTRSTADA